MYSVFTRATLYVSGYICDSDVSVCSSVRPSVTAGIVSKRRELAPWFLHFLIAPWFHSLARYYDSSKNSQVVTPSEGDLWDWGTWNRTGDFFAVFRPISRRISETVQDQGLNTNSLNRVGLRAFDWHQNQWPRMTLKWIDFEQPVCACLHYSKTYTYVFRSLP